MDVVLPSGEHVPQFGLGTWRMGEMPGAAAAEQRALETGLEQGIRLLDTAEMYGDGGAEKIVGKAIRGRRDGLFIVSKVYPHNADIRSMRKACEASLRRMNCGVIDLYLLHWPGSVPLGETVEGFNRLQQAGKIRHWGVSNFDCDELSDIVRIAGSKKVAANQILYNLQRRWPDAGLASLSAAENIPLMAYSPLDQGRLLSNVKLAGIADEAGVSPVQLALAWLLAKKQVMVIPKAVQPDHLQEILSAPQVALDSRILKLLDIAFPAPAPPAPLEIY